MDSATAPLPRAAIYARMSLDREGQRLGIARQVKACREKAAALGWEVVATFEDNDRSASNGRPREAYASMLQAVESREVDAVVCWAVDRLTRTPVELEHVIDLAERTGVQLATCAGDIDLGTDQGRLMARVLGAFARGEVERKSARQKAANDQRAEAGLPYKGPRAFGYEPDGLTVRDSEAHELRRAAADVIRGQSLSSIVADLRERGIRTAGGREWSVPSLKYALTSPRNRGLRQHRGEIVGPAAWPAIFDEDTATAVRAILTDPARRWAGAPRRYLLSSVLRCGKCGGSVTGAFVKEGNKGPQYRCMGHVHRKAEKVDAFVLGVLIERLSRPDALELFAGPEEAPRLQDLAVESSELRRRQDALAEAFAAGQIDMQALSAGTRRLRDRAEAVDKEIADLKVSETMHDVLTAEDVRAHVLALPMDIQRALVEALMKLTLLPVGRGPRRADPGVRIQWREDPTQ